MPYNLSEDLLPPRNRPTTPVRTPESAPSPDAMPVHSRRWSVVLEHLGHSLATFAILTGGAPLPLSRTYAPGTRDAR